LKRKGIDRYIADEEVTTGRDILCKICEKITYSDFAAIELTQINPNVLIEFGIILGRRKPVFILFNKKAKMSAESEKIPADIVALDRIEYSNQRMLSKKFEKGLDQYIAKLDNKKRETETMMKLALASAHNKEFSTSNKLLEIIFERMQVAKGKDGKFTGLLEEISNEAQSTERIRYLLALARVYGWHEHIDKSVEYAKKAITERSLIMRKTFERNKSRINQSVIDAILNKDIIHDPLHAVFEVVGPTVDVLDIFAAMLCIMENSLIAERMVDTLSDKIRHAFSEQSQIISTQFRCRLWEPNVSEFDNVSALYAFSEIKSGKQKHAKKATETFLKSFEQILADYYKSVLA
jgi:hypothetical protein